MEIITIQFSTKVFGDKFRSHLVYFEPTELNPLINSVLMEYSNSKLVEELLAQMQSGIKLFDDGKIQTGRNETFITISNQEVLFDMEYVTEFKPVIIELQYAIDLFEKYLAYLIRYESCQIPGLIPTEKLEEWRVVPLFHIKDKFR